MIDHIRVCHWFIASYFKRPVNSGGVSVIPVPEPESLIAAPGKGGSHSLRREDSEKAREYLEYS